MSSNGSGAANKKVLTQEEFIEVIKGQRERDAYLKGGPFFFENYIVDGIKIDDSLETDGRYIIFISCDVINLDIHIVSGCCSEEDEHGGRWQTRVEFTDCYIDSIKTNMPLSFYSCTIKNYKSIESFTRHRYESTINGHCIFEIEPPMACPKEGEFIGYKKCVTKRIVGSVVDWCIVKLLIPSDAKRSSAMIDEENSYEIKCRCSKARVLGIYRLSGIKYLLKRKARSAYVQLEHSLDYKVGEYVYPDEFDDDRYEECSNGIHFFMTFKEAKDY